jgi:hypothetical protein
VVKKLVVEPWAWLAGPAHHVYWSGRAIPSGCTAFFSSRISKRQPSFLLSSSFPFLCDVFRVTTSLLP